VSRPESESWVALSKEANRNLFSELNVLLRALDRFLISENSSSPKESPVNKNFFNELKTVRDVILRMLGILEVVIPESKKNSYWFQKYAESKLLTGRRKEYFREEMYRQETPENSIFLLYDSFISLKGVITDILRSNRISYMSYTNIGQLIKKEIRDNIHFNPFAREVNPEFDVIEHREITDIVKGIGDKNTKKIISVIFLHLFKFLRYLGHVDIATQRSISLSCSLLVLILLKTEIELFRKYVEKTEDKLKDESLNATLQSLSFQFSMESRRVYLQELKDALIVSSPRQFRGRIENSYGIMRNLTEQSVIQLAQFWRPELKGRELFESYTTKLEQSLKLREDIYVLLRLTSIFEKTGLTKPGRVKAFKSLISFMAYFESFTFRLLRYDDYEEFAAFFSKISKFGVEDMAGEGFEKFFEECSHLKIFLETTYRQIANRAELKETELDKKKAEGLLRQYLTREEEKSK
jgi:hypothetical protein